MTTLIHARNPCKGGEKRDLDPGNIATLYYVQTRFHSPSLGSRGSFYGTGYAGPSKPANAGCSMAKQFLFLLLGLSVGFVACRLLQKAPEPWIPVLEGTSFVYLNDPVTRVNKAVQAAKERVESNQLLEAGEDLKRAMESISQLQFYFIPMTETRQLVYDADRLFFLGRIPEAKDKLSQAKEFQRGIGDAEHHRLRKPADELFLLLDDLLLTIDEAPRDAPAKFLLAGNRVNLMLLRGDLVLTGAGIAK